MKTSPTVATRANDVQQMKLTLDAKHAARHADLTNKRAQLTKAALKAAKRVHKLARKSAKKAAKKARRIEEALAAWIKRVETKPKANRKLKARQPAKTLGRTAKTRKTRRKVTKPRVGAAPPLQIPTATPPLV